jgi:hypothetical protein
MCLLSLVTWHGSTRRRATEQARNRSSIIYNVLINPFFSLYYLLLVPSPCPAGPHHPQAPAHAPFLKESNPRFCFLSSLLFPHPSGPPILFFFSLLSLSLSLSLMYSVDPSIMFLFEAWNPPAAYADVVMSMYPYSSSFSLYFKIYIFFKPTDYS